MLILGIESSCDETALSVSRDGREILSNCVLSQIDMHTIYGGVVPEIASRKHIEAITGLADEAIKQAGITKADLDAIAVTYAPGLIGALLVGVNFAKAAALALNIPIIPVHHIRGHIAANYIAFPELEPPFVCLSVSGGNTLILDVRDYPESWVPAGMTQQGSALTRLPVSSVCPIPVEKHWTIKAKQGIPLPTICPVPKWMALHWT